MRNELSRVRAVPWNVDDFIKEIKYQKNFLRSVEETTKRICLGCTKDWIFQVRSSDHSDIIDGNHPLQSFCGECMAKRSTWVDNEGRSVPVTWKRKTCFYCHKNRKLIGVWCRSCRVKCLRQRIQSLLETQTISESEREALRSYMQMSVWKRFFKKKDAARFFW